MNLYIYDSMKAKLYLEAKIKIYQSEWETFDLPPLAFGQCLYNLVVGLLLKNIMANLCRYMHHIRRLSQTLFNPMFISQKGIKVNSKENLEW